MQTTIENDDATVEALVLLVKASAKLCKKLGNALEPVNEKDGFSRELAKVGFALDVARMVLKRRQIRVR